MMNAKFLCAFCFATCCAACGGGGYSSSVPPTTGDASLSSLSVSGAMLEPPFSTSINAYVARVPYSTTSVDVSASPTESGSLISINGSNINPGKVSLFPGDNDVHIRVHSSTGNAVEDYAIIVKRGSVIDTMTGWIPPQGTGPFGDGGALEVFGQTFVAAADATVLQRLTFWLQHSPNDTSGEDLLFSIALMEWNTDRAVGPVLFESQLQSITTAESLMTEYAVETGGVILVPGTEYVALLSANNGAWNATQTNIRIGFLNSDIYSQGATWTLDTDNDPTLITAMAWDNTLGTVDLVVLFAFDE